MCTTSAKVFRIYELFIFHNKSVNNTFNHNFSVKNIFLNLGILKIKAKDPKGSKITTNRVIGS